MVIPRGTEKMSQKATLIEELLWDKIRLSVAEAEPELAQQIDRISPGKKFTLLRLRYPFGCRIVEKNQFFLPDHSNLDPTRRALIQAKLAYAQIPLGVITSHAAEYFLDLPQKIISLGVARPGLRLGFVDHFTAMFPCTLVSGARSLYMLPKISETLAHRQLRRKYGVIDPPPKRFYDHWKIFKQLAHYQTLLDWSCEILCFTQPWFSKLQSDSAWAELNGYIAKQAWHQQATLRRKCILDLVWEHFIDYLSLRNLKFDPYVMDILRQITYILTGIYPGSAPYNGSDEFGPIGMFQSIYEAADGYNIRYAATIMQPQYFNRQFPTYYSLQLANLFEVLPRIKRVTSTIDNLRDLSELMTIFLQKHEEKWQEVMIEPNLMLKNFLSKIAVSYFHGEMFAYGNIIKSSSKLPGLDPRFNYNPAKNAKKLEFARNSSFFKGCVMLEAISDSDAQSMSTFIDSPKSLIL